MVRARAQTRRELVESLPELNTPDELHRLDEEMQQMVDSWWKNLHNSVARYVGGVAYEVSVRDLLDKSSVGRHEELRAIAKREVAKLEDEQLLGIGKKASQPQQVHINIQGSNLGALNLGTVIGNMETRMIALHESGGAEVVAALKRLTEAVLKDQSLGERKAEVIEALAAITEEAAKPPQDRKSRVVRMLFDRIAPIIGVAGALSEVWQATHPIILGWFGLK